MMLQPLPGPPAEFQGWPEDFEWKECVHDETGQSVAVIGLDWRNIPNAVGLHLEMRMEFGPRAHRQMQTDLEKVEAEARARGLQNIMACTSNDDPKWPKFVGMFGFQGVTKMQFAYLPIITPQGGAL